MDANLMFKLNYGSKELKLLLARESYPGA